MDSSDNNVNSKYFSRLAPPKQRTALDRIHRCILKFFSQLIWLIYWPLAAVLWALNYRFVTISYPDRIGHLAAEVDCYLKQVELGDLPKYKTVLLLDIKKVANPALVALWAGYITIVTNPFALKFLSPLLQHSLIRKDLGWPVAAFGSAVYGEIIARFGGREPIAQLPRGFLELGRNALVRLGVPEGAWFVVFHARGGGYSPKDEFLHAFRNSNIEAFGPAVDEIVRCGGYCIRLGDPTMDPMAPRPGMIDYALSDEKSDKMDIFLCANAKFMLGNTSGLNMVAGMFGVRCVLVNMIPHAVSLGLGRDDLTIPKLVARSDGSLVSFDEIFESDTADFRVAELFAAAELTVIENSADDILDLTMEMLGEIESDPSAPHEMSAGQLAYKNLFRPKHYSYHSTSRIGRAFVEKHSELFRSETDTSTDRGS